MNTQTRTGGHLFSSTLDGVRPFCVLAGAHGPWHTQSIPADPSLSFWKERYTDTMGQSPIKADIRIQNRKLSVCFCVMFKSSPLEPSGQDHLLFFTVFTLSRSNLVAFLLSDSNNGFGLISGSLTPDSGLPRPAYAQSGRGLSTRGSWFSLQEHSQVEWVM